MKKLILPILLLACALSTEAQAPTTLFAIRDGNGIVDGGQTQANAIYIVFKDATAKAAFIDAICDVGNFATLNLPAGQKPAFARVELKNRLNDILKQSRLKTAQAAIPVVDTSDLP